MSDVYALKLRRFTSRNQPGRHRAPAVHTETDKS